MPVSFPTRFELHKLGHHISGAFCCKLLHLCPLRFKTKAAIALEGGADSVVGDQFHGAPLTEPTDYVRCGWQGNMFEMALSARTTIKAAQPKDNLAIEIAMIEVQLSQTPLS